MKMRTVPIEDLIEHPDNPREGDVGAIAVSMEQNGVYRPLVVQASTKFVLAGNHSLKAMRTLGHKRVPIVEVDVDDATARRIMLVDNRASDLASYDNQLLTDLLTDIARENPEALLGTGYDGDDLDDLIAMLQEENKTDGNVTRDPSIGERLDRYKESATRSVMLDYPLDEFRWVVDQLGALRERFGAESSAEAVRILIEQATGESFSAA